MARDDLAVLNEQAWGGPILEIKGSLDSSLKKNTGYIKRIKAGITKESRDALIDGISTISLEKYLDELLPALCESLLKVSKEKDVETAVLVVSTLFQRFGDRIPLYLMEFVAKAVEDPEAKDVEIRNLIRLTIELTAVNVIKPVRPTDEDPLLTLFHQALKSELRASSARTSTMVVSSYVPLLNEILAPTTAKSIETILKEYIEKVINPQIVSMDKLMFENEKNSDEQEVTAVPKLFQSYVQLSQMCGEKLGIAPPTLIERPEEEVQPERESPKPLTDKERFADFIMDHLNEDRALQMLVWDDDEFALRALKYFESPQLVKRQDLLQLARGLSMFPMKSIVIDNLLEQICVGLEEADPRDSQARVAQVAFLGELFRKSMVPASALTRVLYRLVCFGYPGHSPVPGGCELDPPDSYIRVRLICELLRVALRGNVKMRKQVVRNSGLLRLNEWPLFPRLLDYYFHTKENVPLEIQGELNHIAYISISSSLEEAESRLKRFMSGERETETETEDETEEDEEEDEDESQEESDLNDDEAWDSKDSMDESDFEDEIEKQMAELSMQSDGNAQTSLDAPTILLSRTGGQGEGFQLITRSGKNITSRHLELPEDAKMVKSYLEETERIREEKEAIKSIVLNSVQRSPE